MSALNPAQAAAAASRDPRVIVLAGAGTGKTKTGTHWAASQIAEGVPRHQIVMITFTRKAAEEMRRRVHELSPCPPGKPDLFAGTYHSFCSRLLRIDAKGFGLESASFSALDEDDQKSLMRFVFKSLGDVPGDYSPAKALALRSYLINTQQSIPAYLEKHYDADLSSYLNDALKKYDRLKARSNALDYDDLLLRVLKRLEIDQEFAEFMRRRYSRVLVDEFQDNNPLNYAILRAWNPPCLMVVGDQQQAIYRFRGSDPTLIKKFRTENPNVRVLKLEDNYRSGTPVLRLANDVVRTADIALSLKAALERESQVTAVKFFTDYMMAGFVARDVAAKIEEGHPPAEIAVLSRSSQSLRNLEFELKKAGIAYRKYGGTAISDAAEVKDFLSVLRFAANPKDKSAAMRAMCLLPGVGKASAERAVRMDESDGFLDDICLPAKAKELGDWVRTVQESLTLKDMGTNLLAKLEPVLATHYKSNTSRPFEERMENLSALVEFMAEQNGTLAEFLEIFVLEKGEERAHPSDAIVLSTIHSAKGLEWDTVYLYACDDGSMPHPRAYTDADFAEERRLMYVAVTRARSTLMLCASADDDTFTPSRLLPELDWIPSFHLMPRKDPVRAA
jgi:Superfamily I DNA and RNA helicases